VHSIFAPRAVESSPAFHARRKGMGGGTAAPAGATRENTGVSLCTMATSIALQTVNITGTTSVGAD
jgi:hypothetical protein